MDLPVMPPIAPMLAKSTSTVPDGDGFLFEPKFDGFRCIVFRDGPEIELTSRNERPLTRYFPELLEPLLERLPPRCVIDTEIVVRGSGGLDFDLLSQRIHPAASRVDRLARETPATVIAFDILALDDADLREVPLFRRRAEIDAVVAGGSGRSPVLFAPATRDRAVALDWFSRFEGAGLDGVVAKHLDLPYRSGERVMLKVKHERTAECVVAGYRIHKDGAGVGSLLLGLHDDTGVLHHIGVATGFTAVQRRQLLAEMAPLLDGALEQHPWAGWASPDPAGRMPGGQSRWTGDRDLSWEPVRPERVVEIGFTQLQGWRLRHSARFLRWRPDRTPGSCRYDQLDVAAPAELMDLFGG
jgi:ATP-dependent DNA ligase